jgi:hypothetical protein
MSRELPRYPNLEHLRKQAKDLLDVMQQRDSAAQLADAQHALAREYGFASWPQLKTHVELILRPAAIAAANHSPFTGTWVANMAKSMRHPDNPFQRATMDLAVDGNTITITDTVVDADGGEVRTTNTIHADGVEYPAPHGYALTSRWRTPRAIEWEATKNGQPEGRGSYEVSPDGKTLTLTASDHVFVFDRRVM